MSEANDPRDADARALSRALREQEDAVPDVSEALRQRLQTETRDSGVGYVVVQVLLVCALLAAGAWYFWR
ncbi:hypothetical protein [Stenotrophomonas sp. YAU14D1_LEIMI4_1]|uniref:hypothetical protein n=1 Tax=Stenotrophomonas sp. YAU14D1_LEIMI4_1 TaxID=2072407 RepID=UPI000D5414E8|nr:hypothetical protein [Stenotrophomonas sp. YAU14D1_LEIMI4_1]AWH27067.1 hypothetical protein C1932_19150 [Stenotrophomonas sp. YAU14D1_LEIMI4_1]